MALINRHDFATGIMRGMSILPSLMMTATLMVDVGANFYAAGISLLALAVLGIFALDRCANVPWCLAPSVPLAYFLTYEMIISHGLTRPMIFSAAAAASVLGLIAILLKSDLVGIVPPPVRAALPVGLGFMLITTGACEGRLMFPSPDDRYVLANLSEPTAFFSAVGIVITAGLWSYGKNYALGCGMLLVTVIAWAEGFWALPEEPVAWWQSLSASWSLWENFSLAFVGAGNCGEWLLLTLSLLWVMLIETAAMVAALSQGITEEQTQRTATVVLLINLIAACLWCFPLRLAPENIVTAASVPKKRGSAYVTAVFLLGCVFCLPIVREMTSFGAVIAPALIVGGAIFMQRNLKCVTKLNGDFPAFATGLALVTVMGLTQSIMSAIGLSWLLYTFLRYMSGSEGNLRRTDITIVAIWVIYFVGNGG